MKLYPNVIMIVCIWALSVFVVFYFAFSFLPRSNQLPGDFMKSLGIWDGGHYLEIAKNGYTNSQFAFFPLYPLLINLISRITRDFLSAGLIISWVSVFLAVNLLYRLIKEDFGKQQATKVLLALLFFPLSFHFLTVYTESLFLFLTITTFIFARKKNYLMATISAILVSATRLSGLAVVVSLIFQVYFCEGINKKNWFVILAPLGFILYCVYLYIYTGDFFYFASAETHFWQSGLVLPGSAIIHSFKQLITPNFIVNNFRNLLDFLFVAFGIFMVWKTVKTLSLDLAIYSIISLALPLFSPTIVAIPRYLLTIFPIFIVLSLQKNQYLTVLYQTLSPMLLSVYAVLFINGYWVS